MQLQRTAASDKQRKPNDILDSGMPDTHDQGQRYWGVFAFASDNFLHGYRTLGIVFAVAVG